MIEWISPTIAGTAVAGLLAKLIYDGIKNGKNSQKYCAQQYCDQHHKLAETCVKIETVSYEMNDNIKSLKDTSENIYNRLHKVETDVGELKGDVKVLYSRHNNLP